MKAREQFRTVPEQGRRRQHSHQVTPQSFRVGLPIFPGCKPGKEIEIEEMERPEECYGAGEQKLAVVP
jgi:hypothetical protein